MKIKFKPILRITGIVLCAQAALLLLPVLACFYWNEPLCLRAFLISSGLSLLVGAPLFMIFAKCREALGVREALVAILTVWLAISLFAALPYYLSDNHGSIASSLFESVSALTTTGATAFESMSFLPRSLSFWRSFCQWIGGVGILVMLSLLLGGTHGSSTLMRLESPGMVMYENTARYQVIAKRLVGTYVILSALQFLLLLLGGCGPFDSMIITFSSCATGGATCYAQSLTQFGGYVRFIAALFMILASINLTFYNSLWKKEFKKIAASTELRLFLGLIICTGIIVSLDLLINRVYESFGEALRYGMFHTVSFASTTGLYTADCSVWPSFSRILLGLLTFTGGCSVSTTGAIKMFRLAILTKLLKRSFTLRLHPMAVKSVKIDGKPVSHGFANAVVAFFFTYISVYLLGVFVISFEAPDLQTAFFAPAALLNNVGSGFGIMGLDACYAGFTPLMKLFMCLLMLAGRLELYAVILPFTKYFRSEH